MYERRDQLAQKQREALWKWRWLGLRGSTPGFKGSLLVLGVVAVFVALRALAIL